MSLSITEAEIVGVPVFTTEASYDVGRKAMLWDQYIYIYIMGVTKICLPPRMLNGARTMFNVSWCALYCVVLWAARS